MKECDTYTCLGCDNKEFLWCCVLNNTKLKHILNQVVCPDHRRKRNRDTATQSYYKRKQRISELTDQVIRRISLASERADVTALRR